MYRQWQKEPKMIDQHLPVSWCVSCMQLTTSFEHSIVYSFSFAIIPISPFTLLVSSPSPTLLGSSSPFPVPLLNSSTVTCLYFNNQTGANSVLLIHHELWYPVLSKSTLKQENVHSNYHSSCLSMNTWHKNMSLQGTRGDIICHQTFKVWRCMGDVLQL